MALIVQKYGGSSLSDSDKIVQIARRVADKRRQGHRLILVVSAMGKTTDELVRLSRQITTSPHIREMDMLLSAGERISMALMSMALNDNNCPAISFTGSQAGILTDSSHSNARILDIRPFRLEAELEKNHVVVLAGFQGVNPEAKEITTLGRGGTDTTAVAMAAHFRADQCEILKDVDGVYSADPNLVPNAKRLPILAYNELLEMTYWGAKVLHYRSVELASRLGIPLFIGLCHGTRQGTSVGKECKMYEQGQFLSVNSHKQVIRFSIAERELQDALGQLATLLEKFKLPWPQVLDTERSQTNLWIITATSAGENLQILMEKLEDAPAWTLDREEYSTVAVTCHGSVSSSLPHQLSHAIEKEGITVFKLLLTSLSQTLLVKASQRDAAVRIAHTLLARR